MRDNSCRSEDIIDAFEDMCHRLERRRTELWGAYKEATTSMMRSEYDELEHECWSVLDAGLSGLDAEQRMLERDYRNRLKMLDDDGAVA